MRRRPPRSTRVRSSAASDVYKRQPRGRTRPPSCLTQVQRSDSCAVTRVRTARIRTESPEAKRAGDALLRGTTPLAQDTPAEQDRIRELGLVVADVHGDLHGLDDALGCRLDCPNLVLLRVEEEPNDLRLRGGSRLPDGLLQNHVTSRGRSRGLGRVQDADVEGFADRVRPGILARWHVSTPPTRLVPAGDRIRA